jgi:hypothetical protein
VTPEYEGILSADEFRQLWLKTEHDIGDIRKLLISHAALINKVKWLESAPLSCDEERELAAE